MFKIIANKLIIANFAIEKDLLRVGNRWHLNYFRDLRKSDVCVNT